ncbi:STAS domain-containing protein [Umezawaea endophytica]|uniref:Anti-sigma factor antagonist n=1 Tax=Umezawaea endophytica TaxID=1654476 RepID=A0A9X2VJA6_9PSEU|nr:STAS domain-containing protein [Umezawaea endophytica]MCS7477567.1 STAS domain-containing protein [Umezawaea endophytica]
MPEQVSSPTSAPVLPSDVAVLTLTGEIDSVTAGATRQKALAAVDARPSVLVLDLTEVHFFGSNGIAILLETAQRAELRGIRFVVVADQHAVLRPLQVTGVDVRLTIRPTLPAALDALERTGIPLARSGGA